MNQTKRSKQNKTTPCLDRLGASILGRRSRESLKQRTGTEKSGSAGTIAQGKGCKRRQKSPLPLSWRVGRPQVRAGKPPRAAQPQWLQPKGRAANLDVTQTFPFACSYFERRNEGWRQTPSARICKRAMPATIRST